MKSRGTTRSQIILDVFSGSRGLLALLIGAGFEELERLMENNGILNWRSWSIIHKAQVIGALGGAVITLLATIGISLLLQAAGRGPLSPVLVYLQDLTLCPAQTISQRVLGWKWQIVATPLWRGPSWWQMLLAILTNAVLLSVVGTVIGWFAANLKRKRRT